MGEGDDAYLLGLVEEVSNQAVVPAQRPVVGEDAGLDAVVDRLHPAVEVGAAACLEGGVRVALVAGAVDAGGQVHEQGEAGAADRGCVLAEAGDLGRVPVAGDEPHEVVVSHCNALRKRVC